MGLCLKANRKVFNVSIVIAGVVCGFSSRCVFFPLQYWVEPGDVDMFGSSAVFDLIRESSYERDQKAVVSLAGVTRENNLKWLVLVLLN